MSKENQNWLPIGVVVASAILCFVAIADLPYGFYKILRWVVCSVAVASALRLKEQSATWVWVLVIVALIFNPLFPVHFDKPVWKVFNIGAGIVFLTVARKLRK
jgi:hypothetical protein